MRTHLNLLLKNLSPRELEVYRLLVEGFNNQELLDKLHLSLPTVKQYKSEVMRKLNVKSLSKLIVFVLKLPPHFCIIIWGSSI